MKVVVAHNRYTAAQPSGENTVVDAEIAALTAAGVEIVPFLRSSDDIGKLPAVQKALLPISPAYNRWAQRELANLLAAERPDVLHLHNPYPLLSPWVVRTAHRHGVPVIQTIHNYRHDCAAATYFRDGRICRDCHGRRYPLPAVVHSCYRGSRAQSVVMATTLAAHRGTWQTVDRFIALSQAVARYLESLQIPADKITVKPNGVPDPGQPPDDPGSGFLFFGRLSVEKGLRLLLDAWGRHVEGSLGTLRIAGDGELRELAESAAAGRADIEYLGRLDPMSMRRTIRAAAAVVVPSTWDEPCPLTVAEAMANGRPVLGCATGGIPDLVGDTGWVVAPTADALAVGLSKAAAEAASLRRAARLRFEEHFTEEVNVRRLLGVYQEVSTS
jgi:glycosyltransferase involved in cell wall biosynthesis